MIKLEEVSYQYKSGKMVLENINEQIQEGEIISIIGKNGSGKSTLLKLMAGLMKPTKGKIFLDEEKVFDKKNFLEIRKKIGIVFQNPDNQVLFPNVYDDMEFALKNLKLENRKQKIEEALKKVNMLNFEESDTYTLSLGQKQRINIASVLAIEPNYILMDEPTTMIDSKEKQNVYDIIKNLKEEGRTIIFVTNNINEILLSDKVWVLEDGKVKHIFDKEKLLDNIELLEESDIQVPDMLRIVLALNQNKITIKLNEWTAEEIVDEIIRVCKK